MQYSTNIQTCIGGTGARIVPYWGSAHTSSIRERNPNGLTAQQGRCSTIPCLTIKSVVKLAALQLHALLCRQPND